MNIAMKSHRTAVPPYELKALQVQLDRAAEHGDARQVATHLLSLARLREESRQEPILDEARRGLRDKALRLADLHLPNERLLWLLVLAADARRHRPDGWSRCLWGRIQDCPGLHLEGWQGGLARLCLPQVDYDTPAALAQFAARVFNDDDLVLLSRRLVNQGAWEVGMTVMEQVRSKARQWEKLEVFEELVSRYPEADVDQRHALMVAWRLADGFGWAGHRARAYAIVAERIAAKSGDARSLFHQATSTAREVKDQECLREIMADIAIRRAAASCNPAGLLQHALAETATIHEASVKAEFLIRIATVAVSSGADPRRILLQALASAKGVTLPFIQLDILDRMAQLAAMAGGNHQPFFAQALTAAESCSDAEDKALMLANIACHFVAARGNDPLPMFRRALRVAATLRHSRGDHHSILASIVESMAQAMTTWPDLFAPTLALARRLPSPDSRAIALTTVAVQKLAAGTKPQDHLREALAILEEISSPDLRGWAFAKVAARVAECGEDAEPILRQALAAPRSVSPREQRSALANMLGALTGCGEVALCVCQGLLTWRELDPHDFRKSAVLATIAEQVAGSPGNPPRNLRRALAMVKAVPGSSDRARALGGILSQVAVAPGNPQRNLAHALTRLRRIRNRFDRAEALAVLVRRLATATTERAGNLPQAMALARCAPDDQAKAEALLGLAEQDIVGSCDHPETVDDLTVIAESLGNGTRRDTVLTAIAQCIVVAGDDGAHSLDRALALTARISCELARSRALAAIFERLSAVSEVSRELLDRLRQLAGQLSRPEEKARAWAVMAELTARTGGDPDPIFRRARARARRVRLDEPKVSILAQIARAMANTGADPWPVFREAMEITNNTMHELDQPGLWHVLVRHMATAGDHPDENLRRIVQIAAQHHSLKTSSPSECLASAVELIAAAGGTARDCLQVALTLDPIEREPLIAKLTTLFAQRQDAVGFKRALDAGASSPESAWLVCAELSRLFPEAAPDIATLVSRDIKTSAQPARGLLLRAPTTA